MGGGSRWIAGPREKKQNPGKNRLGTGRAKTLTEGKKKAVSGEGFQSRVQALRDVTGCGNLGREQTGGLPKKGWWGPWGSTWGITPN